MPKRYNKNRLQVIMRVQEEFMKHARSGKTTTYIYKTYIYPQFLIGRNTFYRYLATPAKRELLKMEEEGA
ncbi:MAG: hypothetical protein LBV72_19835 [Tannerella sp.]|jgi:hypothetical protein|nr:hypothetical protein [Tannerella sp.]